MLFRDNMREASLHINTRLQDAVMKVLHYYSLFKYPVNAIEINGSCSQHCTLTEISDILNSLVQEKKIYTHNGYYCTRINIAELVHNREKGNKLAIEKERAAKRAGKLINSFPFVRFVGISGSLSKGYATDDSDFDFFIVTAKNRLWICRTILHLFKKLTFLVGREHRFCMNYFVDTDALHLNEKNIFTAIELASLIPLHGSDAYNELMESNPWMNELLPNGYVRFRKNGPIKNSTGLLKKTTEFILNKCTPEKLNYKLMRLTDDRWRKKWAAKHYPMQDYDVAFKTTAHISKNHPANYQKKVLATLQQAGFND